MCRSVGPSVCDPFAFRPSRSDRCRVYGLVVLPFESLQVLLKRKADVKDEMTFVIEESDSKKVGLIALEKRRNSDL